MVAISKSGVTQQSEIRISARIKFSSQKIIVLLIVKISISNILSLIYIIILSSPIPMHVLSKTDRQTLHVILENTTFPDTPYIFNNYELLNIIIRAINSSAFDVISCYRL